MAAPRQADMCGKFQGIQPDAVDDDRQYIQNHIKPMAEYQHDYGKYNKDEMSKQRADHLIDG